MTPFTTARRALASGAALAALTGGLALAAPAAHAAPVDSGASRLTISPGGSAARALSAKQVRIGAVGSASGAGAALTLPVSDVSRTSAGAVVTVDGRLTLRAGRRTVSFGQLRATLGLRSSISARAGQRRLTILALPAVRSTATAGGLELDRVKATLTPAAARLLRKSLRLRGIVAGPFGRVGISAKVAATGPASSPSGAPAPTPPAGPSVTPPQPGGTPGPTSGGGGGGGGGGERDFTKPPAGGTTVPCRTDVASGLPGSALGYASWGFAQEIRNMFHVGTCNYNTGEPYWWPTGGATQISTTSFGFPVASAAYDAQTRVGQIQLGGALRIGYKQGGFEGGTGQGIWVNMSDLALSLNGGSGTLSGQTGAGLTWTGCGVVAPGQRTFATLTMPTPTISGDTVTWTGIGATLTDAQLGLCHFPPGTVLDPITVTAKIPGVAVNGLEADR